MVKQQRAARDIFLAELLDGTIPKYVHIRWREVRKAKLLSQQLRAEHFLDRREVLR